MLVLTYQTKLQLPVRFLSLILPIFIIFFKIIKVIYHELHHDRWPFGFFHVGTPLFLPPVVLCAQRMKRGTAALNRRWNVSKIPSVRLTAEPPTDTLQWWAPNYLFKTVRQKADVDKCEGIRSTLLHFKPTQNGNSFLISMLRIKFWDLLSTTSPLTLSIFSLKTRKDSTTNHRESIPLSKIRKKNYIFSLKTRKDSTTNHLESIPLSKIRKKKKEKWWSVPPSPTPQSIYTPPSLPDMSEILYQSKILRFLI